MIPWLNHSDPFPPAEQALEEPNGLLAAGGCLSTNKLLAAYRAGIFPWYSSGEPILWWSPSPRCVLFPEQLHISKSMRKQLNKKDFTVFFDRNFNATVAACAEPRQDEKGTWITREMKLAYANLHQQGHAHSVEVYINEQLVGGLYGIAIGKVFFGESMFSRVPNASKIAFIKLTQQLQKWGYGLIDCQVSSDHLFTLGANEIARDAFMGYLEKYIDALPNHSWAFEEE